MMTYEQRELQKIREALMALQPHSIHGGPGSPFSLPYGNAGGQMNTNAPMATTESLGNIPAQMQRLNMLLGELTKVTDALQERISPMLAPEMPEVRQGGIEERLPVTMSPVADNLAAYANRLEETCVRLAQMTKRVEL